MQHDTDVLIIGAGMSGLGLAVQLIRQYNTRNFELIEKTERVGGTWWLNSYPGCGCDVPSHFFSYSFALNPNWSQKFALQPEIEQYFNDVASKYDIQQHVRFRSVVKSAHWDEIPGMWIVTIQNIADGSIYQRRCKILVSAVGALSIPKQCDIAGASSFQGSMFHSARWDHSFDWKDKDVVVIGNGCSATQIVPVISDGPGAVRRVTQFSRQAHWLAERPNPEYSNLFKWTMKWIPFAMRLYRARLYWEKERDFRGFDIETGAELRKAWAAEASDYIRKNSPAKYRDFLMPKTEIGCKRRVNDTDYLLSLHRDNVELVYEDPAQEILPDGVRTKSGRHVSADAIVLANGFETQKFLAPMKIRGERGVSINDHWARVSENVPSSYFGSCLCGFPNFFILMGPNTLSGHLSVIYTTECQINFLLRIIQPVMKSLRAKRSKLPSLWSPPDIVAVTAGAEAKDIAEVQEKASKLVWATGCVSWFIDLKSGRNSIMYPDWQYRLWLRSVFIRWSDFRLSFSRDDVTARKNRSRGRSLAVALAATIVVGAVLAKLLDWI
ncbi:Baeyer-Villiger monooxygenase [Tolypocladium ophioglossoides CBS 100239]|uniref:L-ornithine N(5)-monooxygenase [NAD(P)H] n=1 Tax=Tolypocladium ophioglossoides (strain CBS 100239) TaxID=1163406 RepID=A0A0L0MX78_TOLOC|nr:Baeyer-Villiger monooxygenase [Tolypocladium ophioglossoides CBS 100239]